LFVGKREKYSTGDLVGNLRHCRRALGATEKCDPCPGASADRFGDGKFLPACFRCVEYLEQYQKCRLPDLVRNPAGSGFCGFGTKAGCGNGAFGTLAVCFSDLVGDEADGFLCMEWDQVCGGEYRFFPA